MDCDFLDTEYRLFLEIAKNNHSNSELRITVVSAYEPRQGNTNIGGDSHYKFWSIIDARLNDITLTKRKKSRR